MAMVRVKTQVHLTPRQHRELSREARRLGVSLAELMRRLADTYLDRPVAARPTRASVRAIVGLFRSGSTDIARRHHDALDEALRRAPVR